MALVVEDGTGKTDAESYVSVTDASAYHAARGNTSWPSTNVLACEQALRKAADFMSVWRLRWGGYRISVTQAMDWPRYSCPRLDIPSGYASNPSYYDPRSVPVEVTHAQAELALRAVTGGDLNADLTSRVKRRTIGPITTEFDTNSPETKRFPQVEAILSPLFKRGGGASMSLRRA